MNNTKQAKSNGGVREVIDRKGLVACYTKPEKAKLIKYADDTCRSISSAIRYLSMIGYEVEMQRRAAAN